MSTPRPPLPDALADYLNLRRALGFQLANAGRLLDQFVGCLQAHGVDTVTTERALAWATLPAGASAHWWAIRLSVVRGFAAYLHSLDPSVEVPPAGVFRTGPCHPVSILPGRDPLTHPGGGCAATAVAGRHLPEPARPACDQRHPHRGGDRPG